MVRKTTLKTKILSSFAFSFIFASAIFHGVNAATVCTVNNGVPECTNGANFQVNIPEILTVNITRPNSWATGNVGDFLRNVVTLSVVSNNPVGFAASMTSDKTSAQVTADSTATALRSINSSSSSAIPMLSSAWTRSDTTTTKFWGYSIDDSSETGTYNGVALKDASPTVLIPAGTTASAERNIYFGAKADSTVDSGTYQGTVIISVVSGVAAESPVVTPVNPVTPDATSTNNPAYDGAQTAYTATTYSGTIHTSTLEISEGDTRSSYQQPQGVSTAKINEGTPLATGLAVTAAVAAVAGIAFFVAARRREEEDDDEY